MSARRLALPALGLAAAAGLALWSGGAFTSGSENFRAARIALPPVVMTDAMSGRFDLPGDIEAGALVVINFSYTTCDSICPLGNQILQFVDERRGEVRRPVHLLTITIDPRNDTPDKMRAAAHAFDASDNWHWLTSSPATISRILRAADTDVADLQFHDPVFLVGDIRTGHYFRSLSMPDADELIDLLARFDT